MTHRVHFATNCIGTGYLAARAIPSPNTGFGFSLDLLIGLVPNPRVSVSELLSVTAKVELGPVSIDSELDPIPSSNPVPEEPDPEPVPISEPTPEEPDPEPGLAPTPSPGPELNPIPSPS